MKVISRVRILYLLVVLLLAHSLLFARPAPAGIREKILSKIKKTDSLLLASPKGIALFGKNAGIRRLPASTLKVMTSMVALHYLGPGYRFKTELYITPDRMLKVKGYGDPLFTSEAIAIMANALVQDIGITEVDGILLDNTFFGQPIIIPGITGSANPYDAPNAALSANFNTVYYRTGKNGAYESAEPQTPLLPRALEKIKARGKKRGRIVLSHDHAEATLYAGELVQYYLDKAGMKINGSIGLMPVTYHDRRVMTFRSPYPLTEVVEKLLAHSNNFLANQMLIVCGAKTMGPPGSLAKGVGAMKVYAQTKLGLKDLQLVEGSGISRKNKISAHELMQVLMAFSPWFHLMKERYGAYYKTGTLNGVQCRAGYIPGKEGLYPFVIFINRKGQAADPILKDVVALVKSF